MTGIARPACLHSWKSHRQRDPAAGGAEVVRQNRIRQLVPSSHSMRRRLEERLRSYRKVGPYTTELYRFFLRRFRDLDRGERLFRLSHVARFAIVTIEKGLSVM
jgi:hypothetical protein